jgi:hypothetical protein
VAFSYVQKRTVQKLNCVENLETPQGSGGYADYVAAAVQVLRFVAAAAGTGVQGKCPE